MKHRLFIIMALLIIVGITSAAQDGKARVLTVSFEGVTLQYNTDIAENVAITLYTGDPVEGAGPGFSDASHFTFQLYNPPYPEMMGLPFAANIRVYRMSDLAQYDFMQEGVNTLKTLLDEQPDLNQFRDAGNSLPFLPIYTHGQILTARANYLSSESVRGVTYITVFQAAAEPFLSNSFSYTFQGINLDDQYYISADFSLNVGDFPAEFPDYFNYDEFIATMDTYIAESVTTLNNADDQSFTPYLTLLDGVIQSITFNN